MTKRTITCLVNDNFPGTPNPLIYTVDVENPQDENEVLSEVYEQRRADIGEIENEELDLELLVAFDGDLNPVADWRD